MEIEGRLREIAERHRQEREPLTSRLAALDEERDRAIREAADAGLSRRRIASLVGISFQRVHQILERTEVSHGS